MMKNKIKLLGIVAVLLIAGPLMAQKVNYKYGVLQLDETDLAKVVKIKDKENFGLTSTYELYSMTGEKLIIATVATNFVPTRNDNSSYYYQFTFLPLDKVAIFSLNKPGAEKSFAKLIGESGIVVNDKLDPRLFTEIIARRSQNPVAAIEYHLLQRERIGLPLIKENQIFQGNTLIGIFKDISSRKEFDTYEFSLSDGLVIAKASFKGGNSAQNYTMSTNKDKRTQNAVIPSNGIYGELYVRSEDVDRNAIVLKQIATWLLRNNYL